MPKYPKRGLASLPPAMDGNAEQTMQRQRVGTTQKRPASCRTRPMLREVMRLMLLDKELHMARYSDLVEENRRRGLYRMKAGGYPIASRLQVRATAYPHWFDDLGGGKVRLIHQPQK